MCNISARLGVKLPSNKNMQHVCLIDSETFTIVMFITVISLYQPVSTLISTLYQPVSTVQCFGIFRPFHDSENPIKLNFLQGQNTGIPVLPVYFFRYTDTGIFSYRTPLLWECSSELYMNVSSIECIYIIYIYIQYIYIILYISLFFIYHNFECTCV